MNQFPTKDNFSERAGQYAKFRPTYPEDLFRWLFTKVPEPVNAWDCGTGNGQVAVGLAKYFQQVYATDISENQLMRAMQVPNIIYKKENAEKSSFPDSFFDLVTVAQAIHWFNFDAFYREVNRTMKPSGILAVIGYHLPVIDKETDRLLNGFYTGTLGPYWDPERKYIDAYYRTIPFPYSEIAAPDFKMELDWNNEQFTGFLSSWSALQHYIKAKGIDPLPDFVNQLDKIWKPGEIKKVKFPVLLRVGKIIS